MANAKIDPKKQEQQHPQWRSDRQTINQLLEGDPTDYNLCELARMRIRYDGFPGARDIQADITKALTRWQLTENDLYERTRQIHQEAQVYKGRGSQREDWS